MGPSVDDFDLGPTIEREPLGAWRGSIRALVAAVRLVRRRAAQVDLVHAHGTSAGWLVRLALVGATRRGGPPEVVTFHNLVLRDLVDWRSHWRVALEAALPARVDAGVAVSSVIARGFAGSAGASRLSTIAPFTLAVPAVASRGDTRARLEVADDVPMILAVARLHPQKDLATLVRATALIRKSYPNLRVLIAGDGPSRGVLCSLVDQLGLADTIEVLGQRSDVPDLLACADVYVSTARWESVGLATLEALRAEIPVVSTPVGVVPDLLRDGVSARIVDTGSAQGVAAAVEELLADPTTAREMAAAGKDAVEAWGAPESGVDALLDVYREVLAR